MDGGGFGLPRGGDRGQPSMEGSGSSTCLLTRGLRPGADCVDLFQCPRSGTSQGEPEVSHAGSIYTTEIGQSSPRGPLHPPRPREGTLSGPALPSTLGKQRAGSHTPPSKTFVLSRKKKSVVLMICQTLEQLLSRVAIKKSFLAAFAPRTCVSLCCLFIQKANDAFPGNHLT